MDLLANAQKRMEKKKRECNKNFCMNSHNRWGQCESEDELYETRKEGKKIVEIFTEIVENFEITKSESSLKLLLRMWLIIQQDLQSSNFVTKEYIEEMEQNVTKSLIKCLVEMSYKNALDLVTITNELGFNEEAKAKILPKLQIPHNWNLLCKGQEIEEDREITEVSQDLLHLCTVCGNSIDLPHSCKVAIVL